VFGAVMPLVTETLLERILLATSQDIVIGDKIPFLPVRIELSVFL